MILRDRVVGLHMEADVVVCNEQGLRLGDLLPVEEGGVDEGKVPLAECRELELLVQH